jgi:hypothetical protein
MSATNFPQGITSYGVPITGPAWMPIPGVGGKIFFVDAGQGNNSNDGTDKELPLAGVDYAVGKCTANRGDVIVCLPGHVETISAAAGWDLDVAGIHIIGIGRGADQPKLIMDTANTVDVDIDAAGISITNIHFESAFADIVGMVDVNAVDFMMTNCRFTEQVATENNLITILTGTANQSDRMVIQGCTVLHADAAGTHFIKFPAAQDSCIIRDNWITGDFGTMCIGGAGVITNVLIHNNVIRQLATTNDSCVSLAATATGIVSRNICGAEAAGGQANHILAPDCLCAENYCGLLTSEDLSGVLDPVAT